MFLMKILSKTYVGLVEAFMWLHIIAVTALAVAVGPMDSPFLDGLIGFVISIPFTGLVVGPMLMLIEIRGHLANMDQGGSNA